MNRCPICGKPLHLKMYILGPENNGEGIYYLITEEGECLASHLCSNRGFARGDLEARRTERQKEWKERFGEYEVLNLGDDDMTKENLIRLNKEWWLKEQSKQGKRRSD